MLLLNRSIASIRAGQGTVAVLLGLFLLSS
jgi:hypothetical protein